MGSPVKVSLKNAAVKVSTVMDDELHQLVLEGQVSAKDAVKALKDAGLTLSKRVYPWLRLVENKATGEFNAEPEVTPEVKPDLLSTEAEQKVLAEPDTAPELLEKAVQYLKKGLG